MRGQMEELLLRLLPQRQPPPRLPPPKQPLQTLGAAADLTTLGMRRTQRNSQPQLVQWSLVTLFCSYEGHLQVSELEGTLAEHEQQVALRDQESATLARP